MVAKYLEAMLINSKTYILIDSMCIYKVYNYIIKKQYLDICFSNLYVYMRVSCFIKKKSFKCLTINICEQIFL